ncbi:MAG: hypothetical protein NTV26_04085 [Caldiserica bacterium]|nr:hypothetical protein [Caldisericota bacterium]
MKASKPRSRFVTAAFMSILLAVVLAATGCAPRVIGTRHVPDGNDMATMIKNGEIPYKNDVPAIALTGAGTYTTNFSATFKVTGVENTRAVMGETTSLVSSAGREPHHVFVVFYLCQPLSAKADRLSDGTVVYGGTGYPKIIEGQTYVISGILQPHWQGNPLVYVPTANEFKQTTGSESFVYVPEGALELEVPAMPSPEQVVRDYFKYWSEGNFSEMEKYVTSDKKALPWEGNNVEFIELQHLTEILQGVEGNRMVFVVIYHAKLKKALLNGLVEDTYTYEYMLKREGEDSPWLIYDWEVSGE